MTVQRQCSNKILSGLNVWLWIFILSSSLVVNATEKMGQHDYKAGEAFTYFFEDTDYSYAKEPTTNEHILQNVEELQSKVTIRVLPKEKGKVIRQAELFDIMYKEASPANYNTTPYTSITKLIKASLPGSRISMSRMD